MKRILGRSRRLRRECGCPSAIPPIFLSLSILLASCTGSDRPAGPSGPGSISVLEGNGAAAPAGTVLPGGPTFELLDAGGAPRVDATILVEVVEGDGQVAASSLQTDSRGRAMGTWILGRDAGAPQRLRASFGSLSVEATAQAVPVVPGQRYLGREAYTEYLPGTLPLIFTAPHGGYLQPVEIPDRGWGTTGQDRFTRELTLAIREALLARTGAYPHVVLSNLHRSKLDPNREIVEAAQGNREAEQAWWEFQIFAEEAGKLVEEAFGEGLHLDIHGHAHAIDRLELGYLLSGSDLAQPDGILSSDTYVNKSSVRALAEGSSATLAEVVRGPFSLGTLLENRLVPAVPSTAQPHPGQDEYFTGGYNTDRHGSAHGGSISAIQIEHHFPGLRDEEGNRERYAEALADALVVYLQEHFGLALGSGSSSAPAFLPGSPRALRPDPAGD